MLLSTLTLYAGLAGGLIVLKAVTELRRTTADILKAYENTLLDTRSGPDEPAPPAKADFPVVR
jgi:hypothetical protein